MDQTHKFNTSLCHLYTKIVYFTQLIIRMFKNIRQNYSHIMVMVFAENYLVDMESDHDSCQSSLQKKIKN